MATLIRPVQLAGPFASDRHNSIRPAGRPASGVDGERRPGRVASGRALCWRCRCLVVVVSLLRNSRAWLALPQEPSFHTHTERRKMRAGPVRRGRPARTTRAGGAEDEEEQACRARPKFFIRFAAELTVRPLPLHHLDQLTCLCCPSRALEHLPNARAESGRPAGRCRQDV